MLRNQKGARQEWFPRISHAIEGTDVNYERINKHEAKITEIETKVTKNTLEIAALQALQFRPPLKTPVIAGLPLNQVQGMLRNPLRL